jgi:hypothetical protein
MKAIFRRVICVSVFVLAAIPSPHLRAGQPHVVLPETPELNDSYHLDTRVLVGGGVAARVKDRIWSQLFRNAGYSVTIETDDGSRMPGIRARESGRRAVVEVVGLVDRRDVLRLGKKQFRPGDAPSLKVFLDDLAKHGADGPIRLRPTWGLSVPQYEDVLKHLSERTNSEIRLSSPVDTVKALQLSPKFDVTWHKDSQEIARLERQDAEAIDMRRMSNGTGLAIAMAQFGLGFRVLEHPRSGYVLEIDVGDESSNFWPIGWKNKQSLTTVLPKLYQPVTVDLPDEYVSNVIVAVAARVKVPHYCSHQRLLENGIDFSQIRYSAPFERRSPSALLRSIGGRHKIVIAARTDEAGQMFLWCTTAGDHKAWKQRFAHVVPGKNE